MNIHQKKPAVRAFTGLTLAFFCMVLVNLTHAQQMVRGHVPAGSFEIDPGRTATWSDKQFAAGGVDLPVKDFSSENLDRWTHEFPSRYASLGDRQADLKEVDLQKWAGSSKTWSGDADLKTPEASASVRTGAADGLLANEKWARKVDSEKTVETTSIPIADFMAQVGIRPLEEPELKEKLNEFSRPPGQRASPSAPLEKAAKF